MYRSLLVLFMLLIMAGCRATVPDVPLVHKHTVEYKQVDKHSPEYKRLLAACKRAERLGQEGHYTEAAAEYELAVALATRVLGLDDPNTVSLINNLGNMYYYLRRYSEAEVLYK